MTRKLASIQCIKKLLPIQGADRIEIALVQGWQIVTAKGTHKEGDLVIFYEIDSFLPASDLRYASFSERFINWGDKHGMRLKTVKLRKTLSQGLIMPIREFPELTQVGDGMKDIAKLLKEGDDVTEVLKIEKWEPIEKDSPERVAGSSQGKRFPAFIRKTDQARIQNIGDQVAMMLDEEFEQTIKVDGSSLTVFRVNPNSPYYDDAKAMYEVRKTLWQRIKSLFVKDKLEPVYGICSRNVLLPLEGDSNFHKGARRLINCLEHNDESVAIQAELIAPDIQGNYEKVDQVEVRIFDVYDIDKQGYKLPDARQSYLAVACAPYDIPHVTISAKGKLRDLIGYKDGDDVVKLCLDAAEGPGDNPGVKREGLVWKSMSRDFSFKCVSTQYLLLSGK